MESFGDRLKQRRIELKLSQQELGKRAKVSQGTIAQLETGLTQSSARIIDLANALNVSPEWLLYGKNPPADFKAAHYTLADHNFLTSKKSNVGLKLSYLKKNSWDKEYIDFFIVPDESMAPTINIFDDIAVNRLETTLHENGVFVIKRVSGLIIVRRTILDASANWVYRCDNFDKTRFSDVSTNRGDEIIGRVVWRGGSNSFNF
ncbi:helix-turn-helix domain-containing protein [Snodgrassella sp. B3088]|uniref:helix-turn-helix domain-containing protein n=1 Tax=Snodgrassella sp. B3088 TaxID=2818038 RepID=UPI00226AA043|nr:helix-turn-helix domain-containing protein [Snodgrassella sp. B3088]MCX8748627.1 helix-turn-helix domain-containing protein [Snodgrassella sp. B3088]